MSVETLTTDPPPACSATDIRNVPWADPCPRVSTPLASIVAVRAAPSCSVMATVPLYFIFIGPSLMLIWLSYAPSWR
jgi:hypothetical protein